MSGPRSVRDWRAWIPLVAFLAVFGGGAAAFELTGTGLFTSLLPFALLAVTPWVWWVHLRGRAHLGRARGALVAITRLSILGLLVAALAEPRTIREDRRMAVVFAVDHSASIQSRASDAAISYLLRIVAGKPETDEAGLVFFGRNAGVELPPAMSLPFESINVEVDREGTDLAEALSLSAALLPPGRSGRLVLMSDGVQTEGDLSSVLDDLASRGIAVDVVPIDYEAEQEVWLEKLEIPPKVKIGETIEPAVVLSALQSGGGIMTLEQNGAVIAEQEVRYRAGKNRFTIPVLVEEPGYYELVARIAPEAGQDQWQRNNVAMGSLFLEGKGAVLVVTDPEGDPRDSEALVQALTEQERAVEVLSATALPQDPLPLLPYDAIVFVNTPRDAMDERQMQAVHDAVFDQGSGFLMVGGPHSFGPGGYHRTVIEDLLPVSLDMSQKKVMPKGALAIILHTCEFSQGNTWGKRITLQAMKVLDNRDEVGVLAHDSQGGDRWLFPLTPAAEYVRLAPLVHSAQIGDMPGFSATMRMAYDGLTASDASTRHVIVISDGDPSAPPPVLLQSYRAAGISVSTVTVFPHSQKTDLATMQMIAAATGGRHYQPTDPSRLPSIFIKEAKTLRRSAVQSVTFTPQIELDSPILKGIAALPPLHGYVLTLPKARALTILEGPEAEDPDPVLCRWRYGVGVSAAFTSDLSPGWGRDWVAWDRYRAFVHQLITDTLRPSQSRRFTVRSVPSRGEGLIQVEDHGEEDELVDLHAAIDGPEGTRTVRLTQTADRRYEARFPLSGVGRYRVVVRSSSDPPETVHSGFAVPYSGEYLRFRSHPVVLREIAERTGGRVFSGDEAPEVVFDPDRMPRSSSRSVVDLLLAVLVLLLPLEVAFRRVQIDLAALVRVFRRAPAEEGATMGALLARKEAVAERMRPPAERRAPHERETQQSEPAPLPARRRAAAPAPEGGLSTTERLLELKKRGRPEKPPSAEESEER